MKNKTFESFCRKGEKADELFREGAYRDAHDLYARLLHDIDGSGLLDGYLIAKVTLGLLLTHVKLGQFSNAFAIWNASLEDSLFGIGIYGLEHAQTSLQDILCYDFICAYLHSLSAGDKEHAANAVNQYMTRIHEHLSENDDEALLQLALSNWKQHLREIYGSSIPHAAAWPLIAAERSHKTTPISLQAIDFPLPSQWSKPATFHEVSVLLPFQTLEFKARKRDRHDADVIEDGNAARKLKK